MLNTLTPDEQTAYGALRTNAAWFDAHGVWSAFRGEKSAEALNGLVTNDVSAMAVGASVYAAALTPKGKMVTDMLIVRFDETTFLISVLPAASAAWLTLARKYVNPRLCKVTDDGDRYRAWMIVGSMAVQFAQEFTADHSARAVLVRPMGNVPAILLLAESTAADGIQNRLESSPIIMGSPTLWNLVRIEAGIPAIGVDMDENTIPQEVNLDTLGAISFSKGCYTGQETVARLHFRGHVNKQLRGLLSNVALITGAEVTDSAEKVVGDVRSTAVSPRLGSIALAMIRREVAAGDQVRVASPAGLLPATVVDLPFV
ncbi:MAG: glycine cleavage T C-terminal barrel domain-containing protein [Gemmatimonas sp.]